MNRERAEGRFLRPAPWVCDNPMRRRQIVTMSTRFAVVLGAGLGMLCASLAGVPEASATAVLQPIVEAFPNNARLKARLDALKAKP